MQVLLDPCRLPTAQRSKVLWGSSFAGPAGTCVSEARVGHVPSVCARGVYIWKDYVSICSSQKHFAGILLPLLQIQRSICARLEIEIWRICNGTYMKISIRNANQTIIKLGGDINKLTRTLLESGTLNLNNSYHSLLFGAIRRVTTTNMNC